MKMQKRTPRNSSFAGLAIQIGVIALACPFLAATQAQADVYIYTYTGNDYSAAFTNSPYTTSESVSGSFDLSSALADNLNSFTNEKADLLSFSFSDGQQTITNNTAGVDVESFEFKTNASGQITNWEVEFTVGNSGYDFIQTECVNNLGASSCVQTGLDRGSLSHGEIGNGGTCGISPSCHGEVITALNAGGSGEGGLWTASVVPEPATWGLLLLGFGAIGFTLRRSRRRQPAVVLAARLSEARLFR